MKIALLPKDVIQLCSGIKHGRVGATMASFMHKDFKVSLSVFMNVDKLTSEIFVTKDMRLSL